MVYTATNTSVSTRRNSNGTTHLTPAIRCGLSLSILVTLSLLLGSISTTLHAAPMDEPVRPLPLQHGEDPDKVALGERQFHDPRLSADNSISCASCHNLASGGTDHRARSIGIGGRIGPIKAPTVYNSRFNLAQFWDGRATTLEQQVDGPLNNPLEMGSSLPQVVEKLRKIPEVVQQYSAIYPDGLTADNLRDAIACFERSLVTSDAPFDRWLRGDKNAIGQAELEGYRLFKRYGCISCHQGINVGGNMYGYMGAMGNYFANRGGDISKADLGRYNVTGREEDRFLFKVPGLRLAAINPPYFHDGSASTLTEAVKIMGRFQLGREIPAEDIERIIRFLHSLVGRHPRLHP